MERQGFRALERGSDRTVCVCVALCAYGYGSCVCLWCVFRGTCKSAPGPMCAPLRAVHWLGLRLRPCVPAPISMCLGVLAPRACPPSSWQCTAGPGGCVRPPDERWQVCNKPLVTVMFLSSHRRPPGEEPDYRTALLAGLRLRSCPPPSTQGCSLTGAAGRRGPWAPALPLGSPGAGGLGLVCATGGRGGEDPLGLGFAGYYGELRRGWYGGGGAGQHP